MNRSMRAGKNNLPTLSGKVEESEEPSLDARSGKSISPHPCPLPLGKLEKQKALAQIVARPGKSIAKQSEDRVGEKYLPVDGRVRKLHAVRDQQPPSLKREQASFEGAMRWMVIQCAQEEAAEVEQLEQIM
jgi:hypothetical protein